MIVLEIKQNQAGQRLDKFLGKFLPEAPAGFFYKMLRKKNITLNGKKAEGREVLRQEDQVTLWLADETILKFGGFLLPPQSADPGDRKQTESELLYSRAFEKLQGVTVIYEDAHVLILNKPAGMLTQQARTGDLSLNEWMVGYLLHSEALAPSELRLFRPSVCNRLDRNTSGLVLCGKSLPGSQALSELIRSRALRKFYRTLCGTAGSRRSRYCHGNSGIFAKRFPDKSGNDRQPATGRIYPHCLSPTETLLYSGGFPFPLFYRGRSGTDHGKNPSDPRPSGFHGASSGGRL